MQDVCKQLTEPSGLLFSLLTANMEDNVISLIHLFKIIFLVSILVHLTTVASKIFFFCTFFWWGGGVGELVLFLYTFHQSVSMYDLCGILSPVCCHRTPKKSKSFT